jgi:hypothetical protein
LTRRFGALVNTYLKGNGRPIVKDMTNRGDAVAAWFTDSADWVLMFVGAVALLCVLWCAHHVRREYQRRRRVDAVRMALAGRVSVAELRERCDADRLPRYPTPATTRSRTPRGGRSTAPSGSDVPPTAGAAGHHGGEAA